MNQFQFSVIFNQNFWAKHKIVPVQYTQYLPDLAQGDFFFIPNLKIRLKSQI